MQTPAVDHLSRIRLQLLYFSSPSLFLSLCLSPFFSIMDRRRTWIVAGGSIEERSHFPRSLKVPFFFFSSALFLYFRNDRSSPDSIDHFLLFFPSSIFFAFFHTGARSRYPRIIHRRDFITGEEKESKDHDRYNSNSEVGEVSFLSRATIPSKTKFLTKPFVKSF